jgi:hypothetical protein
VVAAKISKMSKISKIPKITVTGNAGIVATR